MEKVSRRAFIRTTAAAAGAAALPTAAAADHIGSMVGIAAPLKPITEHPWRFWCTHDQEMFYEPCDTIEEAIACAKREGYSHIARCQQQDYDLDLSAYRLREMLIDHNEEKIGEGEFPEFSPEAEADLEQMVEAAIRAWALKHKIDMTAWSFAATEGVQRAATDDDDETKEASNG